MEGLLLKLKLQYFGHLVQRADSLKKTLLTVGKIEGLRQGQWERMRWLDSITESMDTNMNKLQEIVGARLIRPVTGKGIESVIRHHPRKKNLGLYGLTVDFLPKIK